MANYKIKGNSVIEIATDQTIKTLRNKRDAISLCNLLNSGSGFNGFTPSFFVIKIPLEGKDEHFLS